MNRLGLLLLTFFFISISGAASAAETVTSTAGERSDLSLTVYNSDIALVSETRDVTLPRGESRVRFLDVPGSIIPESIQVRFEGGVPVTVLEQSYEHDLVSPDRLIDKYVGRKVWLEYVNPVTGREQRLEATILSNRGGTVFRVGDEIILNHAGKIIFPGLPEGLHTEPSLSWTVETEKSADVRLAVQFLARNITWKADYNLLLAGDDTRADLRGWITLNNRSGFAFEKAKLTLVAGEVNVAPERKKGLMRMKMAAEAAPRAKEDRFFEYHTYSLQRRTTLEDNAEKQISMVDIKGIPVKKRYMVKGEQYFYFSRYREGTLRGRAGVFIELKAGDGIPLPAGTVRVYKRDRNGETRFIGSDNIDHVAAGETVRIRTGDAFDILYERRQADWLRIAEGVFESSIEIKLRNRKDGDVTVTVIEPVPGEWMVLKTSHDFRKTDANTLEFDIKVPKKKETVLNYRVRVIL